MRESERGQWGWGQGGGCGKLLPLLLMLMLLCARILLLLPLLLMLMLLCARILLLLALLLLLLLPPLLLLSHLKDICLPRAIKARRTAPGISHKRAKHSAAGVSNEQYCWCDALRLAQQCRQ